MLKKGQLTIYWPWEDYFVGEELNRGFIFADIPCVIEDIKYYSAMDNNKTFDYNTKLVEDEFYSQGIILNPSIHKHLTEKDLQ
jgi:hypothetical protein